MYVKQKCNLFLNIIHLPTPWHACKTVKLNLYDCNFFLAQRILVLQDFCSIYLNTNVMRATECHFMQLTSIHAMLFDFEYTCK